MFTFTTDETGSFSGYIPDLDAVTSEMNIATISVGMEFFFVFTIFLKLAQTV